MLELFFEEKQNEELEKIILNGLSENTLKKTVGFEEKMCTYYNFFYKDEHNQVQAGLVGFCYCGCVYINMLWVHPDYRSQKLGATLVENAEKFGREQNCTFSTVNTMEWEAPEFYKKLGYEIEFIREGYVDNHRMFFLRKPI